MVALLGVSAALVVGMWIRHDGLAQLGTVGGALTAAGQLTALLPTLEPTASAAPVSTASAAPVSTATAVPVPTDATVTGRAVRTPYGNIQVQVTIKNGKIKDITALQMPDSHRYSRQISGIAEPMLRKEALRVQSARIHVLSGATYTSEGYARSLPSALDQAGV